MAVSAREEQRSFLNKYYGISRHFYDVTRKYYLFGRDVVLRDLLEERWDSLVEVGAGTGRNLKKLERARPEARYGAVDASDAMLDHMRERYPWIATRHGFAEDVDLTKVLPAARPVGSARRSDSETADDATIPEGVRPDRVLFSYCLSMVGGQREALENARRALAPGGAVTVVDFADLRGLPAFAETGLRKWLNTFHVEPLGTDLLEELGAAIRFGPGRYYVLASLPAEATPAPTGG